MSSIDENYVGAKKQLRGKAFLPIGLYDRRLFFLSQSFSVDRMMVRAGAYHGIVMHAAKS